MRTKDFLCLSFIILTTALNVVEAQGQELPISDKQNSGCLSRARSYEGQKEPIPTIILTKEGSILSVEVQNFVSNCATYDFAVSSEISEGSDGSPCSLSVIVNPILPNFAMACTCPFNVSFTIRDLEPNNFYLDCWWYKGMVSLTNGTPLVLNKQKSIYHPSDADPKESLYGEWRLVGYSDGGNWFEVDPKFVSHRHFSIEIPREGYVRAYSFVNDIIVGLLTLNGNEMIFDGEWRRFQTYVGSSLMENRFFEDHILDIKSYQLEGKLLKLYYTDNDYFVFTSDFDNREGDELAYRPFVEEGKVWKLGDDSGNPVKRVEYYYFDGDTIINGKTCKQMKCQRYVNPNHPDYAVIVRYPLLTNVGAWYEEDKKVYVYNSTNKQFVMKYDFSLVANDTLLIDNYYPYVVGPKQTGGLEGFKGVYRDIMWCGDESNHYCTTWLEGVGGIDGPTTNVYYGKEGRVQFLMSCVVGDEVIYHNDEYEDGATPAEARKNRFDFTHTIKTKPKARKRSQEELTTIFGEYNDHQLGIHLDPLDDTYQVCITDESGNAVYEKAINAGTIVGLNIDISNYAKGRYTVTVENSRESFTGAFEAQTTGIKELKNSRTQELKSIYNLQGQRLSSLQKGLNIVDGQKIYVKQ